MNNRKIHNILDKITDDRNMDYRVGMILTAVMTGIDLLETEENSAILDGLALAADIFMQPLMEAYVDSNLEK